MDKLRTLVVLSCLFGVLSGMAQEYTFQRISIEEGLSQSSINAIAQDDKGFLWLGTQDGLNRYDGRHFTVFKRLPFDSTSLADNFITSLLIDSQDRLWVGTQKGGLHLYDPKTERFRRYSSIPADSTSISNDHITVIHETTDQQIWVGTANGFNQMQTVEDDSLRFTFIRHQMPVDFNAQRNANFISALQSDSRKNLWIGTMQGLRRYRAITRDSLEQIPVDVWTGNKQPPVEALQVGPEGDIWVGSRRGLYRLVPENEDEKAQEQFRLEPYLIDQPIIDLNLTNDDHLMAVTFEGGILRSQLPVNDNIAAIPDFIPLSEENEVLSTLTSRIPTKLFVDQKFPGLYWLGTRLGGVQKVMAKKKKFYTLYFDEFSEAGLSPSVRFVFEDSSGWVWVGLNEAMLKYELASGSYQVVFEIPIEGYRSQLRTNMIASVHRSADGRYWAATYIGLFELKYDAKGQLMASYRHTNQECEDLGVFNLYSSEDGFLLGTHLGLNYMPFTTNEISTCPTILDSTHARLPNYRVHTFLEDRNDNLWLGSTNGLMLFNGGENRPFQNNTNITYYYHNKDNPSSLVDDYIHQIVEDRSGQIWLATRLGLSLVTPEQNDLRFTTYREKDGLANDVVYSILVDSLENKLWLSTNNGLSRFDPLTREFDNFRINDGLQSNEFNEFAAHRGQSGRFYFGGVNGLTYFFPHEVQSHTTQGPIWITKLALNSGESFNLLEADRRRPVELDYGQNAFTIHFVGIDYYDPEGYDYLYDLEGAGIKDARIGKNNLINFPRLEPGNYTFCVRAVGINEQVEGPSDSLTIIIRAPYWRQTWFYMLIGGLCLAVIWGGYHLTYLMKMRRIAEIEKVRINAAQDFHDELGSKLSVISMYSELTKEQLSQQQQDQEGTRILLDKVIQTSNSLYDSMKDMIWALNPEQDKLEDLFFQLKDFGENLFSHSDIEFRCQGIQGSAELIELSMHNKRHILLIFKEAMHNALKHSGAGLVHLNIYREPKHLLIELQDDGQGFALDQPSSSGGEGLQNMRHRAEKIKCQLNIQSGKEGTTIQLRCPLA